MLGDVAVATIPFHVVMFVLLATLTIWLEITLWLPARMVEAPR